MAKKKIIARKDFVNQVSKSKTPSMKKVMCEFAVAAMSCAIPRSGIDFESKLGQSILGSFWMYVNENYKDIVYCFKEDLTMNFKYDISNELGVSQSVVESLITESYEGMKFMYLCYKDGFSVRKSAETYIYNLAFFDEMARLSMLAQYEDKRTYGEEV